jgi:hypothetical protein
VYRSSVVNQVTGACGDHTPGFVGETDFDTVWVIFFNEKGQKLEGAEYALPVFRR